MAQFHLSVPVPFQFLSQFLFQFLLRMCCVFQGFLLQPFFSRKKRIFHFFKKKGLQQNPLKNTAHPQKELEKELGKELEGNWDGGMELEKHRAFHYPGHMELE